MKSLRVVSVLFSILLFYALAASAQTKVGFTWDASPDANTTSGYELRIGTETGVYALQTIDAGQNLAATSQLLQPGTYFAAAFAYTNGDPASLRSYSDRSNEVKFTVPAKPRPPGNLNQPTKAAVVFSVPADKVAVVELSFKDKDE